MTEKTDKQKAIAAWVAKVSKRLDGKLTPEALVADARDPGSEGHDLFDWDVERAAMEHWLERARQIIRSVKVEITTNSFNVYVPMYVKDPTTPNDEQGYSSVVGLRTDKDKVADVLLRELRQINSALLRAQGLASYFKVEADFIAMLQTLQTIREMVERKETA